MSVYQLLMRRQASTVQVVKQDRIFNSVESGCQIIEAGIDSIMFTGQFGNDLLTGEDGIRTGYTFLVCSLSELRQVVKSQYR